MSFIENCRSFISLDSTPEMGTEQVARFAADLCSNLGMNCDLQEESLRGVKQFNLVAKSHKDEKHAELFLQTHIDTVDPGSYALWSQTDQNPFKASIYGDHMYGLGAADAKLDLICKIEALARVGVKNLKKPLFLLGSYGIENAMAGALRFIRKNRLRAKYALIGEPTSLNLVTQGIGFAHVEVTVPFSADEKSYRNDHDLIESSSTRTKIFHGKAAHASNPQLGENAISKMLEYLENLPSGTVIMDMEGGHSHFTVPSHAILEVDFVGSLTNTVAEKLKNIINSIHELEKDFLNYPAPGFSPELPTMNISFARTMEDGVRLEGSCRIPPSVPEEVYFGWIQQMEQFCGENGAVFRLVDYKSPFMTNEKDAFVEHCESVAGEIGMETQLSKSSVVTEASLFSRLGMNCVLFGPGEGMGNSHAPNEKVSLGELEKSVEFYARIIERTCL